MVNSQQTQMNRISESALHRAGVAEGTIIGLREGAAAAVEKELADKGAGPVKVVAVIATATEPKKEN
jgi:hypothetical protein